MMTRIIIVLFFFFLFVGGTSMQAQKLVVNSRDHFSMMVGYAIPKGEKVSNNEATLLPNMSSGFLIEGTYTTTLFKRLHIGADVSRVQFSSWNYTGNIYKDASATFTSIGPTLMYKTWSPINRLKNNVNFFAQVTPGLAIINVQTSTNSRVNEGNESNPLTVRQRRFFTAAEIGINYNISNAVAISLAARYQYATTQTQVFSDKTYAFFSWNGGVVFSLIKDKRYKLLN